MNPLMLYYSQWTTQQKMSFRFFCSFFIINTFPLVYLPLINIVSLLSDTVSGAYEAVYTFFDDWWHKPVQFIAAHILHLKTPITVFTNGSGDTTYNYILLLTQIVLAVLAAIIWSLLDKKRKSYNTAYYWLCVLLRYVLAMAMLSYGFAKVFHLQMPYPGLGRLTQPYGNSSPMGLAWTYVGFSKAYSAFTGWSEVVCGILLLFRKTTLLGTLLSLAVMGNVVIINLCFDVPVKIYSFTLWCMALYLAWPYFKKLYLFFIKEKEAGAATYYPQFTKPAWFVKTKPWLKWLVVIDLIAGNFFSNYNNIAKYGDGAPKKPLYGIYTLKTLVKNNDTIVPLMTDTTAWRQFIIEYNDRSKIKYINDSTYWYNYSIDTAKKKLTFYSNWDTVNRYQFTYRLDSNLLQLTGHYKADTLQLQYLRTDEKDFRLMNRGFNWINEYPFNR